MKRKKIIKRILIGLGIFLVLVIGALAAAPFLFKDEIIVAVKNAANDNLNAKVDFKEVDISLLRSFPNVSVKITDYSVIGNAPFEGIKLIGGEAFGITVDFWSAWNFGTVPLEIKSVRLDKPEINVVVLSDGKANYDIAKPTADTSTTATAFNIQLEEYGIHEANITYDDRLGGNFVKIVNLTHTGTGDFTQDIYDLTTKTSIAELTAESGGIAYLTKARLNWDAGINVDMPNSKYTLRENDLKINDLQVKLDGWLAMPNETDTEMDLTFSAPQSDFKSVLSLIPNAYMEGFENVKASGTFKLAGFVKGKYSTMPETYPAFKIEFSIAGGDVKYPDLPLGISGINTNVIVNSPGADLDQMLVDVSSFKLKIGSNPLEGYFKLRTPISDPDVDTKIKGVLNLEELSKAFPMDATTLNGIVNADIAAKTRMSTIDRGDYANVNMSGSASIQNMNYAAEGMPPVKINSLRMDFTPQRVNLPAFDMKLGKSDLTGSGSIDNILAYFSPEATMKGDFTLRSNYFNADEWMTEEPATTSATSAANEPAGTGVTAGETFNRFDFSMDAQVKKLDYDVYKITDLVAVGNFKPSLLTLDQFSMKIGDSDIAASGNLTNVWNYVFYNETLGGKIAIRSNYLNLNQFMTDESAATATATS
ncbi:MAG: AsmA family protein, partial [Bacteroidota bacterium]